MTDVQAQAKSIFLDALELEQPERLAFVQARCRHSETLCREVVALLEHAQRLGGFLASSAELDPTTDPIAADLIGTQIGPYKLLQEIGDGGMGVVYMADQREPVRRQVALKIVKPGMDSRQVLARFEAERQALAMMDHPNIARIIDAGATDTGRPYFVMELVHGIPINEFCDQHRLTVRARLELFLQVCQAVQHAHQKGIIHRDLKPTNVLVTLLDVVAVPKVIDFGIAKAFGHQLSDYTLVTSFAQLVGTPLYMSPEQAEMNQLGVDTRSDVYSLGVILYELLTGSTPFSKQQLTQPSLDELKRLIREADPPRPSSRISTLDARALSTVSDLRCIDPRRIAANVRGELDWIVMKAIEKDRSRRYESVSGLAADVQRYLNDEAVQACPPSKLYRIKKSLRRHQRVLWTSSLVATALVVGTMTTVWQAVRATLAETKAESQQLRALASDIEAKRQASEVGRQRDLTRQHEQLALAHAESLRGFSYSMDMKLAWQEWSNRFGVVDLELIRHLLSRQEPTADLPDHRSFAWYYLKQRCGQTPYSTLYGHEGRVYHVAISPDGMTLASAGQDGTACLWDLATNELRYTFRGHGGEVNCVAFSPDGKTLATCSDDGMVRFWDTSNGLERSAARLVGFRMSVHRVQYSANGRLLVTGEVSQSRDAATTTIWNLASSSKSSTLEEHFPLAISADGLTLATTSFDNIVRLWDLETAREVRTLVGHDKSVVSGMFSPDGRALATGSEDYAVSCWNLSGDTQNSRFPLYGAFGTKYGMAWSPDGRLLAACDDYGRVHVWDMQSRMLKVIFREDSGAWCLAFSPNSTTLATTSEGGRVRLWDVAALCREKTPPDQPGPITSISFTSDGKFLASATNTGVHPCMLWDVGTGDGKPLARNRSDHHVVSLACSPTAPALAIASRDPLGRQTIEILDAMSGETLLPIECEDDSIGSLTFSADGKVLVGDFRNNGTTRVWDSMTGKQTSQHESISHTPGPQRLAISPDGKTLSLQFDIRLRRWEPTTGTVRDTSTSHKGGVLECLALSADGRLLATGAEDQLIKIWDTQSDQEISTLVGHQRPVHALAFSPDGRTLASGGELGELKVWDVATSQEMFDLTGHSGTLHCIAFSPDGSTLATAGGSADGQRGELRFWRAAASTTSKTDSINPHQNTNASE